MHFSKLLAENIMLTTKIVHVYNRQNIDPSAMLKVDLRMALDSVRWDFVIAYLRALDLSDEFVNWIHSIILCDD